MRITFSLELDGAPFSMNPASCGEIRLGPAGLLGLLELNLGLWGPESSYAERIAGYYGLLDAALAAGAPWSSWYAGSFTVDSWSTAAELLSVRDELFLAGWDGSPIGGGSPRLAALAGIEETAQGFPPGEGERLQAVIRRLRFLPADYSLPINEIRLLEPLGLHPPLMQSLFELLENRSVVVKEPGPPSGALPETILLLDARGEQEAAEVAARFLAAAPEQNRSSGLLVESAAAALDYQLQLRGLPRTGVSAVSPWRTSLQILPLVMANLWEPADVFSLAELLSLPLLPFSRRVARLFLGALEQEPGVGGRAWNKALERAEEQGLEYKEPDRFLRHERYDPEQGIPAADLQERCRWIVVGLSRHMGHDPLVAGVIRQTQTLDELCAGRERITRIELERLLDSLGGRGQARPDSREEAADYGIFASPAWIDRPLETLLWWDFSGDPSAVGRFWTADEIAKLAGAGCTIESVSRRQERRLRMALRGVEQCSSTLILVHPLLKAGEATQLPPLFYQLQRQYGPISRHKPEDLIDDSGLFRLAGRECMLDPVIPVTGQPSEAVNHISADPAISPASLSYTQMSTLGSCPMKWALEYRLHIRGPEMHSIPEGNQMLGTFIHRIVEELYTGRRKPLAQNEVAAAVETLYARLLPELCSMLLLPGHVVERARTRSDFVLAVQSLNQAMIRYGLYPRELEKRIDGELNGIPYKGFIDLLLETDGGKPFILDLKWSWSSRYKREELEEGRALQLASYAWLLAPEERSAGAHAGYFMLAQGELLSDSPLLGTHSLSSESPLSGNWETLWNRGCAAAFSALDELRRGEVRATGVEEAIRLAAEELTEQDLKSLLQEEALSSGKLYLSPPCRFCDYGLLCGLEEGAV